MGRSHAESNGSVVSSAASNLSEDQKAAIRRELQNIVRGSVFVSSIRCQEFLSFVVERTLEEQDESLKERVIGTEFFHRPPSYSTGEDPVVRVKASEVRRKLQQHYALEGKHSDVVIDLPTGGYTPKFRWLETDTLETDTPEVPTELPIPLPPKTKKRYRYLGLLGFVGLAAASFLALVIHDRQTKAPHFVEEFWAPLSQSSQPVMICLPSVAVYRPSSSVYSAYSQSHVHEFEKQSDRLTRVLPLAPNTKIKWKDLVPDNAFYVFRDDAYVATKFSELLGRINKTHELRSGADVTFEDLRGAPAVMIGALDNRWTMQLITSLPFTFANEGDVGNIREQKPSGRIWRPDLDAKKDWATDYAIAVRLLHSDSGQPVIIAAGIGGSGTWAAGEFLSNEDYMDAALRAAPKDWRRKNIEVVLQTSMHDGLAGPPRVVASAFW